MRKLLLVFAVAFAAAACNLGSDDSGSGASPPPRSPGTDSETMESRENRLPEGFPTDFPLPSGNRVLLSQYNDQGGLVFFRVSLSDADLIGFFEDELGDAGWVVVDCVATSESPGPATVIFAQKDDLLVTTTIGELPTPNIEVDDWSFYVAVIPSAGREAPSSPATCAQ